MPLSDSSPLGRSPHEDTSNPSARVIVASPVRLLRDGLAAMLGHRDGIAVLDTVDLDESGLAKIGLLKPDVILIDLSGAEPVRIAQRLQSVSPSSRLVSFALAAADENVIACAAAGFSGYVSNSGDANDVHEAIRDAMQGRTRIPSALFMRLPGHLTAQPQLVTGLTARENEILSLASQGFSNKEIARGLAISFATVKNHMHNILQKLQVNHRSQAAAKFRG